MKRLILIEPSILSEINITGIFHISINKIGVTLAAIFNGIVKRIMSSYLSSFLSNIKKISALAGEKLSPEMLLLGKPLAVKSAYCCLQRGEMESRHYASQTNGAHFWASDY